MSVVRPTMTIDGAVCGAEADFEVENPATLKVCGVAPDCTRDQLDNAMNAAGKAFVEWRSDDAARRKALLAIADTLEQAVDELAPILTSEQGKPLTDARQEIEVAALWFRYYAGLELTPEVIQNDINGRVEVTRRPLGVVAAIAPWNVPLGLASWKMAPALLAGNTIVLKPSPFTPLTTLRAGELLREVLPPGVLNVVSGGDELGAWMTAHPVPRKISFTGSVETGKRVAQAAAPDLKRVTLELGGNDPAILLDDVDLDAIASQLFWGAFMNSGQICCAVKRIYAPRARYSEVVDALVAQAENVVVGDGSIEGTQLGPVNNAPQHQRVTGLIAEALRAGATAVTGGAVLDRPGYFFAPAILAGALDGMRIVDEEQFGPALPVVAYDRLEDAVAAANGTRFGLAGSVWSSDPDRAAEVARELDCGTAWINTHLALGPHQPFGGLRSSGLGVENGPWGYYAFTDIQVIHTAPSGTRAPLA